MKKLSFLTALLMLCLFACNKDEATTINSINTPPITLPPSTVEYVAVTASVTGVVINEFNIPMVGAEVVMGNHSTTADENGVFGFFDIEMNENGTYIQADQPGYFKASTTCFPQEDEEANAVIKLIQKCANGTVPVAEGGTIALNGNATIELPANGISLANGQPYNGAVTLSAHWISPLHHAIGDIMPGDLRGVNTEGETMALVSYGMITAELTGDNDEPLQLANGEMATLRFPLPSEALASAPETIPLWYFDEDNGVWIEEGSATLQGNEYVGQVSHFSFWNCDDPFPLIQLSGHVMDENNSQVPGADISITANGMGCGYAYTDDRGYFGGLVPMGVEMGITIELEDCGIVYTGTIGPFDEDTDIGNIQINTSDVNTVTVSGSLFNCDGTLTTEAYALLSLSNGSSYIASIEADSSFTQNIFTCQPLEDFTITVTGVDYATHFYSDPVTYDLDSNLNVGSVFLCNEFDSYFAITSGTVMPNDGIPIVYSPCFAQISNDTVYINSVSSINPSEVFNFQFIATDTGEFEILDIENVNSELLQLFGMHVNITEFNSTSGSFIIGTFSDNLQGAVLGGNIKAIVQ